MMAILTIVLYIASILLWVYFFYRRPYLILRPAFIFSGYMIVFLNFAAAFIDASSMVRTYRAYVGGDWEVTFRLLSVIFPIFAMSFVCLTPGLSRLAEQFYNKGRRVFENRESLAPMMPYVYITLFFSLLSLCLYFSVVPLTKTGLWAMIFDPKNYTLARENSLTLMTNRFVVYLFTFHKAAFAPFLAAALAVWTPRKIYWNIYRIAGLIFLMLSVAIPGARSPSIMVFLVFCVGVLLKQSIKRYAIFGMAMAGCIFLLFLGVTVKREGAEITPQRVAVTARAIVARVLVTPFVTGLCSIDYTTKIASSVGVKGIRPLAWVLEREYFGIANSVYRRYYPSKIQSGTMNTCFLYDYQGSFGMILGWIFSFFASFFLDAFLLLLKPLPEIIRLVLTACIAVSLTTLLSTAYTVALITHGVFLLPVIIFLGWCCLSLFQNRLYILSGGKLELK